MLGLIFERIHMLMYVLKFYSRGALKLEKSFRLMFLHLRTKNGTYTCLSKAQRPLVQMMFVLDKMTMQKPERYTGSHVRMRILSKFVERSQHQRCACIFKPCFGGSHTTEPPECLS